MKAKCHNSSVIDFACFDQWFFSGCIFEAEGRCLKQAPCFWKKTRAEAAAETEHKKTTAEVKG